MIHQRADRPRDRATLLLDGAELRRRLAPDVLLAAVERSLVLLDGDEIVLGQTVKLPGDGGAFHLKSAFLREARPRRAVLKLNGNFPDNPRRRGLPTIQGFVALVDLECGSLLALMDSIVVTALRTAAVSALAARRLARADSRSLALIGCGVQAREHLELLVRDFPLAEARLFDRDSEAAARLTRRAADLGLSSSVVGSITEATRRADIIVTSTPSRSPILGANDVGDGAFVAAVGADNPEKCEISPELLSRAVVVVDSLESAACCGDLRSALEAGVLAKDRVHGELPALVAGRLGGRTHAAQLFVFDSTGLAATDFAAANSAFESAKDDPDVPCFDFAATPTGAATPPFPDSPRRSP